MLKTVINSDLETFKKEIKIELNNFEQISNTRIVTMQLPENQENTLLTFIVTKNTKEIETIKNFIDSIK